MSSTDRRQTTTILRQRIPEDVLSLPVVWAPFAVAVALVIGAVAIFRSGGIEVSGWEQATQLARWYAAVVGIYAIYRYLPLYIAHGYTRRAYARAVPIVALLFALGLALLLTLGYAIEAFAYGLLDWPQVLAGGHLFDDPTQYGLVLTEMLLLSLAWTVAGVLVGAAFYRGNGLGLISLPLALLMVGSTEAAVGPSYIGPAAPLVRLGDVGGLQALSSFGIGHLATASAVAAVVVLIGLVLTWVAVRNMPMKPQGS